MGNENSLHFQGQVRSGLGEGAAFIELDGYQTQFADLLGYDPYPGTLNVELTGDGRDSTEDMADIDPVVIEGWSDGETDYGPVHCYPAVLSADGDSEPVHVVRPVRTRHDEETLEIVAPYRLRHRIGLDDGDPVALIVNPDS